MYLYELQFEFIILLILNLTELVRKDLDENSFDFDCNHKIFAEFLFIMELEK